jgi:hypothetical protein
MDRREKERLAEEALAEAKPSGGGEWLRAACPFCPGVVGKADRSRAFSINSYTGWFHCFRCGTAGRLDHIADNPVERAVKDEKQWAGPPEDFLPLWQEPGISAQVTVKARAYLQSRRVGLDLVDEAKVGVCLKGKYAGRVIVPVLSGDAWLGWVGRAWSKQVEKPYIYPGGAWRGRALFNHRAVVTPGEVLYVVEGVFDALALWPDAAAVLGKPSYEQVEALALSKRPVVVVLDGDAWMEGWSLAMRLRLLGTAAGAIRLPPKTDPDEVPLADLWEAGRASLGSYDAVPI